MGKLTLEVHVIGSRSESDRAGILAKALIFFTLVPVMRFKNTETSSSESRTLQFAERNCQIEGTTLHVAGKAIRLNMGRMWSKVKCIEELGGGRRESQVLIFSLFHLQHLKKGLG